MNGRNYLNLERIVVWSIILFIVLFAPRLLVLYGDYLWYEAVGFPQVFWLNLYYPLLYGIVVGAFMFIIVSANLLYAGAPKKWLITTAAGTIVIGLLASGGWQTVVQHFFSAPFNVSDPVFNKDIGFYVFTYPLLERIVVLVFLSLGIAAAAAGYHYLLKKEIVMPEMLQQNIINGVEVGGLPRQTRMTLTDRVKKHALILLGFFSLTLASHHLLARYQVLYSPTGVVFGATYTSVTITLPLLLLAAVLATLLSIICFMGRIRWAKAGVIVYLIFLFAGLGVLPQIVQQYRVQPSEIQLEKGYIDSNIQFTRRGYGLDNVEERFITQGDILEDELEAEQHQNIRLWDWRPLKESYMQMQEIRSYYAFNDVDIDRYRLSDGLRQLMLSAREIDKTKLSTEAKTWVNQHIIYTHGYGVVGNAVNQVSEGGQPDYLIQDIPPKTSEETLTLTQPEIYYGELTREYVIVGATQDEFDYPAGDTNKNTRYSGRGGVLVDSLLKKLAFTLREGGDINIILSEYLTKDSRIMTNRQVQERVGRIAPYLRQTNDPYITIIDGRMYWIIDAYTTTDRYPYSQPTKDFNYIRNSVKAVVDAYDGTVTLYVVDGEDPIIRMYSRMFPNVYTPWENMPAELRNHIRYPLDLFNIQAEIYSTYHMTDTQVFYNREDQWDIPNEVYGQGTTQKMESYYILTNIPGEDGVKFILVQPFTPRGRDNMISWMAGKSDIDYGKLVVYKYPKDTLIYGPMQIEARIDQDDMISQQLTLWNQRGSQVIRGKLIIIPVGGGVLYIEPLYIQAENTRMPELKRVIGSRGGEVVMARTLDEVLAALYGGQTIQVVEREDTPEVEQTLVEKVLDHYIQAEALIRSGDWAGFGEQYALIGDALKQLANQTT